MQTNTCYLHHSECRITLIYEDTTSRTFPTLWHQHRLAKVACAWSWRLCRINPIVHPFGTNTLAIPEYTPYRCRMLSECAATRQHYPLQNTLFCSIPPSWLLNVYWMRRYRQHYSVHKHRYLWYTPSSLRLLTKSATSSSPTQYENTLFCSTHHLAWGCLLNTPLRAALSSKKTCNSVFDVKVWLTHYMLTHCGRVTQICVFNTVKLGTSASSP